MMGKKKIDRDIALKVLAAVDAVKDARADLMDTMFIIYQPKNWTGLATDNVVFTVKAMNGASYQWQYLKNDGVTWASSAASGNRTDTLTFLASDAASFPNRLWRCKLTDSDGNIIYTDGAGVTIIEGG